MSQFQLKRLIQLAVASRLILFILQLVLDACFEDFDSSANRIPLFESRFNGSIRFFNGVNKWDSVYFIHVSINGYQYEQMLAFYPAFPLLLNLFSRVLAVIFVNEYFAIYVASFFLNSLFFVVSTYYLYLLTDALFGEKFAVKSSLLLIFNPANVFMISSYSESLYSSLQFISLYYLEKKRFLNASAIICLSIVTRSNGILNLVFLIYFFLKKNASTPISQFFKEPASILVLFHPNRFLQSLTGCLKFILPLCFYLSAPVAVFALHIFCVYEYFCHSNHVVTSSYSHWCHKSIPSSYSYVQSKYWNVGFLKYYDTKQIPNFLLAFPVIIIVMLGLRKFLSLHDSYLTFKLLGFKEMPKPKEKFLNAPAMFVYLMHCLFLTSLGLVGFHVQILTRMLFSSCPFLYWTIAAVLFDKNSNQIICKCLLAYFVVYNISGLLFHCNFYPWT